MDKLEPGEYAAGPWIDPGEKPAPEDTLLLWMHKHRPGEIRLGSITSAATARAKRGLAGNIHPGGFTASVSLGMYAVVKVKK